MTTSTSTGGDVLGDILTEARRPGAAEPVAIHVRPELQIPTCGSDRPMTSARPGPVYMGGVPLVVDEEIPAVPGYEIHRAAPSG